jgi:hypothetical protein
MITQLQDLELQIVDAGIAKLADSIEIGAAKFEQGFFEYFPSEDTACVLGMGGYGLFGTKFTAGWYYIAGELNFPSGIPVRIPSNIDLFHSVCLEDKIVILNDTERWSPQQIVAWLRTLKAARVLSGPDYSDLDTGTIYLTQSGEENEKEGELVA